MRMLVPWLCYPRSLVLESIGRFGTQPAQLKNIPWPQNMGDELRSSIDEEGIAWRKGGSILLWTRFNQG